MTSTMMEAASLIREQQQLSPFLVSVGAVVVGVVGVASRVGIALIVMAVDIVPAWFMAACRASNLRRVSRAVSPRLL